MHSRVFQNIAMLFLFSLLLSACNFPVAQATQPPTPSINQLETSVAATLTSQPVNTQAPTFTASVNTLVPTATLTLEPSATATPEVSATPSVTSTPIVSDPAVSLGAPTGRDNLDTGGGFGLNSPYEDDFTKMQITNGAMVISSLATNGWRGWRVRPPKIGNSYLEGTFQTQSCSGGDNYGIVYRAADFESGQGYYFGITCDGRYGFSKWDSGGTTSLISQTNSDKILAGSGQTNRLGILGEGSHFKLYINGELVQELDDTAHSSGYYGIFISGSSGGLTVSLDTIQYWALP